MFRCLFEVSQRVGVNILPKHFYSEIPDVRKLKQNRRWMVPRNFSHIQGADINEQVEFIRECYSHDDFLIPASFSTHNSACKNNGHDGYGRVESDFLLAFIRYVRPKTVVQIGCGVSTAVIMNAAGTIPYKPEIFCIEPYPNNYLSSLALEGKIQLLRQELQEMDVQRILDLKSRDLLFVDSTHAIGPDTDVNRIIFDVLPCLKQGVYVHFHDIYFPYDYQRSILRNELFFQNESNLLLAFLTHNPKYKILASLSMLHYAAPQILAKYSHGYMPKKSDEGLDACRGDAGHFPSSLYLRTVR